jgi:hypothetical protein
MIVTSTPLLRLSQGQLNLLATCPRKFQHSYLEQLSSPNNPEQEEHLTLGSRFHLLMQQREIGLPIDDILLADPQLQTWMSAFTDAAAEILTKDHNQIFRESEHYRTLQIKDYLITVIYDLLIADNEKAQILDWKTYAQKPHKSSLAKNWQTRLYMYVLAETSEYLPENISMTYWFVQTKSKPQNIQFNYDTKQHQKTTQDLDKLLNNLTLWLEKYQLGGQEFPQISEYKTCEYCQYNTRCDRLQINQSEIITPSLLENIQEVSL